jgi:hypothetical protein
VLSVSVVAVIRRPVPHHPKPHRPVMAVAGGVLAKQAELQEVPKVAGVAVLHPPGCPVGVAAQAEPPLGTFKTTKSPTSPRSPTGAVAERRTPPTPS